MNSPVGNQNRFHRTAPCGGGGRHSAAWVRAVAVILLSLLLNLFWTVSVGAQQFGVQRRAGNIFPRSKQQPVPSAPSANSDLSSLPNVPLPVAAESAPKTGAAVSLPYIFPNDPETPSTVLATPLSGVVRLVAFDRGGQSFGSGSYIGSHDEYGLILSNWHVICEADGLVHVHFPDGFSSFGAILLSDKKWDLAVIAVSKPPQSIVAIPIARNGPKPGEPLWIAGHGSGSYRLAGGRCVRYLAPEVPSDGSTPLYEIIELSVTARQGDSGGPILNRNGELAGVLFGSDMVRNTAGSYCERVELFLREAKPALEKLPQRPEVFFASIEPNGPRHLLTDSHHAVSPEPSVAPSRKVDLGGSSFGVRSPSRRYTQPGTPSSVSVFERSREPAVQTPTPSDATSDSLPPLTFQPSSRANSESIRSAVWTKPSRRQASLSGETVPAIGREKELKPILQTRHDIHRVRNEAALGIPDPFDNGLAALNPTSGGAIDSDLPVLSSDSSLRESSGGPKYGSAISDAAAIPPARLATVSERNEVIPPSVLGIGIVLAGLLVSAAIWLLRRDSGDPRTEPEQDTVETLPHQNRAA